MVFYLASDIGQCMPARPVVHVWGKLVSFGQGSKFSNLFGALSHRPEAKLGERIMNTSELQPEAVQSTFERFTHERHGRRQRFKLHHYERNLRSHWTTAQPFVAFIKYTADLN